MVKHVIFWDHLEGLTEQERRENAQLIRQALEGLVGVVPGLVRLQVVIQPLAGSGADLVLDSSFESEQALALYQAHPAHVKAAQEVVRPRTCNRRCVDYVANSE